jgi:O-antigen ligase
MLNRAHRALREHRVTVYTAALLCLLFFHMLWYVNFFLAESLAGTYFLYPIPVLTAFYLYFRGLRDGPEIKLLLLFSLWLALTRVLNGDPALVREGYLVLDSLMMALFLSVGLLLDRRGRRICLQIVSVVAGLFFFALGLLGIYVFVTGAEIVNPLTEAVTAAGLGNVSFYRLTLLGVNPNTTALWFFFSACLMAYCFFACRKKLWRIPIVLCALVDYLAVAACGSRKVKIAFSVSLALLLCIVVLRALMRKDRRLRALVGALILLAAIPLCYLSFNAATKAMGGLRPAQTAQTAEAAPQTAHGRDWYYASALAARPLAKRTDSAAFSDSRGVLEDSGRERIFRAALESLRRQPQRLWKGCLFEERMSVADELLTERFPNFHNTLLDVLNYTGLPGLLLLLAFLVLLTMRILQLLFASAAPIEDRLLTLPLIGALVYSMLEPLFFFCYDFRALLSFLFAGFVIACARETEKPAA